MDQFPDAFEFSQQFLLELTYHTYSGLYGTFLCNSEADRNAASVKKVGLSLRD